MAILKPIPGSPSRLSLGIRQSSKMRLAVDEARMPSLSSFFPSVSPGVGMGTRKALMPCKAQTQAEMFSETGPATPLTQGHQSKPAPSRHLPQTSAGAPSAGCSGERADSGLRPPAGQGSKGAAPRGVRAGTAPLSHREFASRSYEISAAQRSPRPSPRGPHLVLQGSVCAGEDDGGGGLPGIGDPGLGAVQDP